MAKKQRSVRRPVQKKTQPQAAAPQWRRVLFESGVTEERLQSLALELSQELTPGAILLLEGPMGAGKSTFARALLKALGVIQPSEGSPTFALAHEYQGPRGGLVHIDFYRLRSELEIEEAGISSYFWDRSDWVLAEWTSAFPEFRASLLDLLQGTPPRSIWEVRLDFESDLVRRTLVVDALYPA